MYTRTVARPRVESVAVGGDPDSLTSFIPKIIYLLFGTRRIFNDRTTNNLSRDGESMLWPETAPPGPRCTRSFMSNANIHGGRPPGQHAATERAARRGSSTPLPGWLEWLYSIVSRRSSGSTWSRVRVRVRVRVRARARARVGVGVRVKGQG